jgi:uncharacterized protein (DUF1800 family)
MRGFAVAAGLLAAAIAYGQGNGLKAEYFPNTGLVGAPAVTRTDATVNFRWLLAPAEGLPANYFSVRWSGQLQAPVTGEYRIATYSDDGIRVWLNGAKIIDNWTSHARARDASDPIQLTAGQRYSIVVEYYDDEATASAELLWSYPGRTEIVIPRTALFSDAVSAAPAPVYLSEWNPTLAVNGLGPYERDRSNGESRARDGGVLRMKGVKYGRGLGVHARSELQYTLDGKYQTFLADVGIDDEVTQRGSVIFRVFADGTLKYTSPLLTRSSDPVAVRVDVSGARVLTLMVEDGGDGIEGDHADWGSARLVPPGPLPATPVTVPAAPTGLTAVPGNNLVTLSWNSVPGAVSYSVFRATTPNGQGNTPLVSGLAGVVFVDTAVTNATTYYYRVAAVNGVGTGPRSAEVAVTPTPEVPALSAAQKDAYRFLRHATFGPTPNLVAHVAQVGKEAFLEEQFALPPSPYPAELEQSTDINVITDQFYRNALQGEDQLRQRVAFALSQIWVVSAVTVNRLPAMVPFIRMLHENAFGNVRDLLEKVTLDPAMGEFLDMVNNRRADPARGTLPNENYARELLQLFTIGLVKLNPDGTTDNTPAYTEADVLELSRVLTGWTYGDAVAGDPNRQNPRYYGGPMEPYEAFHDRGAKTVLGVTFPANQDARADLKQALDLLFNHPNIAPFLSKQLIQKLVKSNPSPAYVREVAQVFANNGRGVRGDMKAIIKAILLHPEASAADNSGKFMEPALFLTTFARGMNANVTNFRTLTNAGTNMGQRVYFAPSVFNYYSPAYRLNGILAPELQIWSTATALARTNFVATALNGGLPVDLAPYNPYAGNPEALIEVANVRLMGGQMSAEMRQAIREALAPATTATERIRTVIYLIATSMDYQVER